MTLRTKISSSSVAACAALLLAASPLALSAQTTPAVPAAVPATVPAATAPTGVSVSSTIHPGDTLLLNVYGEPPQTLVVQADGTVQHSLAGRVLVGGFSVAEARDNVARALKKYYKNPVVSLAVQQQGQISVTVLGNVKTPNKYQMRSGSRLSDALAAAGGVATLGVKPPIARVQQSDGSMRNANVQKLLRDGDPAQNLDLEEGAYIYVSGAETIRVQVLGSVSRPGNVEVNEGDHLSMALARAGAEAASRPDFSRVSLTRTDPKTGISNAYTMNFFLAMEHGDQRYDPVLQVNDKIWVPEARQLSPGAIGVFSILGRLLGL